MKKIILLFVVVVISVQLFSQSYYYTYTAGKTKFTVILYENKVPKIGEKKWVVTVFDVYNQSKKQIDSTDDPLEIYPFLASSIIKMDKAKMGSVLFNDPNREGMLLELFNKFINDRKQDHEKEDEKKKKEEDEKRKKEEEAKKNSAKSVAIFRVDTFIRRLTIQH